jgi:hypothetical protein
MIIYNIKSFITVFGFFVGLLYATLVTDNPIDLVVYTILFVIGFYSFANLFLAFYIKNVDVKIGTKFPQKIFEEDLNRVTKELEKKEEEFMPQKERYKVTINKQIEKIEESQK